MGNVHSGTEQYFAWHPDHRKVMAPFLAGFDLTFAKKVERGNDRVGCFYLKAEPFIAQLVGLEREILATYAPFSELQVRTLKLHDEALLEGGSRLDPMGSIVITQDPETRRKVSEFVADQPERPCIVALSTAELSDVRDANDLRRILFEQLYQRDLFGIESPLQSDVTFFGREALVNELLDRFRSGQNSGLFGLRRMGKTSVLFALNRRLESAGIARAAYLDVSNPGLYQAHWWEVLQHFVLAFAEPLELKRAARSKVRALSIQYSEKDAATHFKADIQHLAANYAPGRVLLALDEIEYLTYGVSPAPHWDAEFLPLWQTMRSVHQDTGGAFGFVLAGVNPRILEQDSVGRYDNPLFSTTKSIYVSPFNETHVREMVRRIAKYMGLRVEEPLYARLSEEYGGHPFLVRQACSQLARSISQRPGELNCSLFESERAHVSVALERNVRQILNVLAQWYPQEYELLVMLARGDRASFVEFAVLNASFTQHVEGYGLVNDARQDPKIRLGLVRAHLARAGRGIPTPSSEADADWDTVLAEISRRRNRVERKLRQVMKDGLAFARGRRAASEALAALVEQRRQVLSQFDYASLWTELYFNELIAIVKKEWGAFQNYFGEDQGKVISWLEHVNSCRVDAHAKAIGSEDLAYLRVCFGNLERSLDIQ